MPSPLLHDTERADERKMEVDFKFASEDALRAPSFYSGPGVRMCGEGSRVRPWSP